jgi:hypothetical protein
MIKCYICNTIESDYYIRIKADKRKYIYILALTAINLYITG